MIGIRDYTARDLEAVVSVFQRSVREVASRDYTPAQIAVWAPEPPDLPAWAARLGSGGVFVAEQGDHIVGFAKVDDHGHVDLLFVSPECQGQGVARALCERLVSWASDRGLMRLTSEASITARPFFERAGFRVLRAQQVERQGVRLRNFFMSRDVDA